jgi:hypothetical protein
LSLTIGVAFATVLIVGGILAGPTILDCSHQPQSFGACLRDRVDHSRLAPVKDEPSQVPVLSSELSAPSVPAPPPSIAENGGHPDGWLDARANEYEPPATSALEPPVLPPLPALVTPAAPVPVSSAEVAAIEPAAPPALPPLVTPAPLPRPAETSSSAIAEIEIVPPPPPRPRPPATLKPKADVAKPVPKPARVAKLVPKAAPKALPRPNPVRTFKYDPRFPNVTVLGPPSKGSNSSFVTLATN